MIDRKHFIDTLIQLKQHRGCARTDRKVYRDVQSKSLLQYLDYSCGQDGIAEAANAYDQHALLSILPILYQGCTHPFNTSFISSCSDALR